MILELKGIYKEYQQGKMKVPVLKDTPKNFLTV